MDKMGDFVLVQTEIKEKNFERSTLAAGKLER